VLLVLQLLPMLMMGQPGEQCCFTCPLLSGLICC